MRRYRVLVISTRSANSTYDRSISSPAWWLALRFHRSESSSIALAGSHKSKTTSEPSAAERLKLQLQLIAKLWAGAEIELELKLKLKLEVEVGVGAKKEMEMRSGNKNMDVCYCIKVEAEKFVCLFVRAWKKRRRKSNLADEWTFVGSANSAYEFTGRPIDWLTRFCASLGTIMSLGGKITSRLTLVCYESQQFSEFPIGSARCELFFRS